MPVKLYALATFIYYICAMKEKCHMYVKNLLLIYNYFKRIHYFKSVSHCIISGFQIAVLGIGISSFYYLIEMSLKSQRKLIALSPN